MPAATPSSPARRPHPGPWHSGAGTGRGPDNGPGVALRLRASTETAGKGHKQSPLGHVTQQVTLGGSQHPGAPRGGCRLPGRESLWDDTSSSNPGPPSPEHLAPRGAQHPRFSKHHSCIPPRKAL